ncbi:hypothetical protein [Natrinema hispanicum]|uniref:Uncharacterized protein n=1 Tax=Natrinema hispanicum TaxID=392421 RepID=A0A1G6LXN4_9EURY|nr:hypothetical protein [Natrinema hispanicum]SDC47814.1 hypothetical protein SAMN05192552_1004123 [Natrinema hispanicum]SET19007.1 hypothetical protein SAMN04488694_104179 [Natrinema hispanicum]
MSDAEPAADLLEEADAGLDRLKDTLGNLDNVDELEGETVETVIGDVDTLVRVADELVELLNELDLSELPDAVDKEELLDAIDVGEIPDAIANDDGVSDVVEFTKLFDAIDLLNAWNATDLTDICQEKRELDDAVDDLADGNDAGMIEDTVSDLADDDDGQLVGDDEALIETDMDAVSATKAALGDIDVAEDPEAYQVAIQQQAMAGIDAFRTALLETHERFERLYEFNREKMRRQDTSTDSRNPTASSTIPTDRRDLGGGARYSTVPQDVKLSTAPSRKRIYGRRFELERERRRHTHD